MPHFKMNLFLNKHRHTHPCIFVRSFTDSISQPLTLTIQLTPDPDPNQNPILIPT